MAHITADRVYDTSTSTGTGAFTVSGTAPTGYRTFSAVMATSDTCFYCIQSKDSAEWEVGLGTYSALNTITRTTVISSSNANTAVTFSAGTKDIWLNIPAARNVQQDVNGNVGINFTPDNTAILQIGGGTTTKCSLELEVGTLMTTPDGGSIEYDGNAFYFTPVGNQRGVVSSEQFCCTTSTLTLGNNITLQKVFNSSTNGALTVNAATTYFFECSLNLSSMSATSGNMGFSIGGAGTATFTSAAWHAVGLDATTQTTAAAVGGIWSSASAQTGNIVTAGTGTAVSVLIKGIFRINAGGTIIPSIQLTTAAAAVVGVNSWFKCYPVGTNTVTTVGNWS